MTRREGRIDLDEDGYRIEILEERRNKMYKLFVMSEFGLMICHSWHRGSLGFCFKQSKRFENFKIYRCWMKREKVIYESSI